MASATGNNFESHPNRSRAALNNSAKNPLLSSASKPNGDGRRAENRAVNDLIEGEIIPRLMMAHSEGGTLFVASPKASIDPAEAARFGPLALTLDADELMQEVEEFLHRGVSAESVFIDLLAPSARKLGQMWESDECDFLDVTMGLWRLQEVMREVARRSPEHTDPRTHSPSALFSPMPGEQHSFGALMVEEVFARAGWRSEVLLEPQRRELLQVVADSSFDLVGLTVSCDCLSATLTDLITAIRSVSKSPTTKVIIGGRLINANPELVQLCGADGTAADAESALTLAERIVAESMIFDSSAI